jgi:hypothetical protein
MDHGGYLVFLKNKFRIFVNFYKYSILDLIAYLIIEAIVFSSGAIIATTFLSLM